MSNIKWLESNQIQIEPPKNPKKITGTRFASILGLNPWSTSFEIWCAITRVYEKPFEDTIYTLAGKAIEPKQADYMRKSYGMSLISPSDCYGKDYFNKTRGDFFSATPHFGGMWDYLAVDENGKVDTVLEMKTTKRIEDWQHDIPEYYALQAALYAYLLHVDNVVMVASFLEDKDYTKPEEFIPTVNNTITVEFKVSERYPNFERMVTNVKSWWGEYVASGISPMYDEKKDAEILTALRTHNLTPDTDISAIIEEAEDLKAEIDKVTSVIADKEKRLKEVNDIIKEHAMKQFRDGDKKVEIKGTTYTWTIYRSETAVIDKKALEADGLLEKYQSKSEQYRMIVK